MIEEKKPTGRPPKEINWTLFEDLCFIQCTQSEIASVLHLNKDTVHDRVEKHYGESYSETYKRLSEGGKSSLRRIQFNLAKKNTGMAIFLGKQWLGQKDSDSNIHISPEALEGFKAVMDQLAQRQKQSVA